MKKILIIIISIMSLKSIYGGELKMSKVLIVVGSKNTSIESSKIDAISSASLNINGDLYPGATISIAKKVKDILEQKKCIVDIVTASEKTNVNNYDLVVIGSGIYGGQIHESIKPFVSRNKSILLNKRVAVFAVCGTLGSDDKKKRERGTKIYSDKMQLGLNPENTAVFGGTVEDSGKFSNWLGKLVIGANPGDYRDYDNVAKWARSLFEKSFDNN